jgi:hypothetical protein
MLAEERDHRAAHQRHAEVRVPIALEPRCTQAIGRHLQSEHITDGQEGVVGFSEAHAVACCSWATNEWPFK